MSCPDRLELASEIQYHKRSGRAKEDDGSGAEEKQVTKKKGLGGRPGQLRPPRRAA